MVQQRVPVEISNFNAGVITDANPLNFPQNAALEMTNMVIDRNGLVQRRLGIDYEDSYINVTTTVPPSALLKFNKYKWENVGGDSDKSLLVIQCGNEFKVFDLDTVPISNGVIYTKEFGGQLSSTLMSFTSIDSFLIVVNGDGKVYKFEYDGGTITEEFTRITVRDFWGLDDIEGGVDLRAGNNIIKRPVTLTDAHLYNLRNQSFGIARATDVNDNEVLKDPIVVFQEADGVYPSNADSVNYAFYPKASFSKHPLLERFWPDDLNDNRIGTFEAPRGYFIIDLLNRGDSRTTEEAENRVNNPLLTLVVNSFNTDSTSGGATVVAEFAGRAFFAGFSGDITDGDDKSPRLSSYVVFSRVVRDVSDITSCYQAADPTSNVDSALVDTDGGYVRIDGAYDIKALVPSGSGLIILATNGIWRLVGGNDFGFTATNYRLDKLSDDGCRSSKSVVYVDGSILYWGDNGIFTVGPNKLGDWQVINITKDKIQDLYDDIPIETIETVSGLFDLQDRKVRWVYNIDIEDTGNVCELVLDVDLGAFYQNEIPTITNNFPRIVEIGSTNAFRAGSITEDVTVNAASVLVNGANVNQVTGVRTGIIRELVYVVVNSISPKVRYTLAKYDNTTFLDWYTYNTAGVDAPAFVITGQFNTGDNQLRKKVSSLTVHLARTESGMELVNGELEPKTQSSCLVQSQWNWANSSNSNQFGNPRQFYRYKRFYMPVDINDPYDTGYATIVTKDILRGHGKVLSLKFSSEPAKDLQLHGWSMIWGVGQNHGD